MLSPQEWRYDNTASRGAAENHYRTMGVEEIAALPVRGLAAEQYHLHLWVTNAFLFEGLDVPTVVCGHTHTQYERRVGGVRVVNAGSVGAPYEDEPGAYWLLDLVHSRTPYDGAELKASREEAVAEFTERGL